MTTLEKVLSRYGKGRQVRIENHKEIEEAIARMWAKEQRTSSALSELGLGMTVNTITSMAVYEPIVEYVETCKMPVFEYPKNIITSDLEISLEDVEHPLQAAVNMWNSPHIQEVIADKNDYRILLILSLMAINNWVFDTRIVEHVYQVIRDYGLEYFKDQPVYTLAGARSSQEYTELLIKLDDPELWSNADYSIGELFKNYL